MRKVVKPKGSTKRKRGRPKAGKVKTADLTKLEQPTSRADIFFDDDMFEKALEEVALEVRVPFAAVRAKIHAGPLSPGSLAISGCLCLLVLHVTGAPEWAQLGGMLLPWAIAVGWVLSIALPPHARFPRAPRRAGS
jgi:hypothetical protein